MTQLWTITDLPTGAVLCPAYPTPSAGSHPKDNRWPWDPATQKATRIAAVPDQVVQVWTGTAWANDLAALRALRWAKVKTLRDRAEWAGCDTALGRVDTDPDSQRKVAGAVVAALIAQGAGAAFAVDWTMQDNLTVTHDAEATIAMGVAVGDHVAACHTVGVAKRAALTAAVDAAAIAAVDLASGWPA